MNLGNALKKQRVKMKLTQIEVAAKSGITQTYLSLIETGKMIPSIKVLERISNAIEVPMPIITFLSMKAEDIAPDKRDAFKKIYPAITGLIKAFFNGEREEGKCLYKDHIIEFNPNNIYNHKPATYIYYHKDDTDGTEYWGETVQECKDSIDDID